MHKFEGWIIVRAVGLCKIQNNVVLLAIHISLQQVPLDILKGAVRKFKMCATDSPVFDYLVCTKTTFGQLLWKLADLF